MTCESCKRADGLERTYGEMSARMQVLVNNLTWALVGENLGAVTNNISSPDELNDERGDVAAMLIVARNSCSCQCKTETPVETAIK